jgi:hypothetical protein
MLALGAIWREWPNAVRWRSLLISAAVAFVTTLIATRRGSLSHVLQRVDLGYDYEDVHRIEVFLFISGFCCCFSLPRRSLREVICGYTDRRGR